MTAAADAVSHKALLVVDLQNEFLHPDGRFPAHSASRVFLSNLSAFIPGFRDAAGHVVWIVSEYERNDSDNRDATTSNSPLAIGDTHRGQTPCCVPGSHGAVMYAEAQELMLSPPDIIITKKWYSAFRDTQLSALLKERGVRDVFVAGLLSNVCVLATAHAALQDGFNTTVLTDCLGWRRHTSHTRALEIMQTLGLTLLASTDVEFECTNETRT